MVSRAVALAILGVALPIGSEGLRYAPAVGTVLERTIERELHLQLDGLAIGTDELQDPSAFGADVDDRLRIVVTDEILEIGDGRPAKLKRTFDDLGGEIVGSSCSAESCRRRSSLEGRAVVFTWREDERQYDVQLEHAPDRDSRLQALVEDLDLRGFLPGEEVEEGERWSVDPSAVGALFLPGGDLGLFTSDGDAVQHLAAAFSRDVDGWVQATYRGQREEDGVEVEQVDLVAMLEARFAELSGDQEGSLKLELNGVLCWNGAAGHAALLELSGSVRVELGLRDPILGSYPADGSFRAHYAGDVALRIAVR